MKNNGTVIKYGRESVKIGIIRNMDHTKLSKALKVSGSRWID